MPPARRIPSIGDRPAGLDLWRGGPLHGDPQDERGRGRLYPGPQEVSRGPLHT